MLKKLSEYAKLVGNTPLIELEYKYKNKLKKSYFKLEFFNPSGSIKDRMALEILQDATECGAYKDGMSIAEATSGNTGIAFSALGAFIGAEVEIFMPDWMSQERKKLIKSYGAKLREVSTAEGGFAGSVELANASAASANVFLPHQFENPSNVKAHRKTAQEIIRTLDKINLKAQCFVAGVGTGGTVMGVGSILRAQGAKICPLEPEGCASMSRPGENAEHRIQGIGDGFVPDIVRLSELDDIIVVNDIDSVIMAQKLAKIGLGVGISSGANLIGCIKAQELYGDCVAVSVFADDNKKYLSTDLMAQMPMQEGFYSNQTELIGFKII